MRQATRLACVLVVVFAKCCMCLSAAPRTDEEPKGAGAAGFVEKDIRRFGKLPLEDVVEIKLRSDGQRLAYVLKRGNKVQVVCDGKAQPAYDVVKWLKFSPDGKHLAYAAGKQMPGAATPPRALLPGRWYVVHDGTEGRAYEGWIRNLTFSSDSKRLAFAVETGANDFVVCDGEVGPGYLDVNDLMFSQDSRHLAYTAWRQDEGYRVVLDGIEGPVYRGVSLTLYSFSATGELGYRARRGDKTFYVRGGREGPAYDDMTNLIARADGKHVAYKAKRDGKWFVVYDGKEGRPYEDIDWPFLSPDGKRLAYAAFRTDTAEGGIPIRNSFVVADGREGPDFVAVDRIHFSPDGKRLAYTASERGKWFMVCDGRRSPGYDEIKWPVFSADSTHLAFLARLGTQWFAVRDATREKGYDRIRFGSLTFWADGKRFVYQAQRGKKWYFVIDGKESTSYDKIWGCYNNLVYSNGHPDGHHWIGIGMRGGKHHVVCDGVEGPPHQAVIVTDNSIKSGDKLRYLAVDNNEARLVEVDWPPLGPEGPRGPEGKDRDWTHRLKPLQH